MMDYKNISRLWLYAIICTLFSGYLLYDFYLNNYSIYMEKSAELSQEIEFKKKQLARILAQNLRKGALDREIKEAADEFAKLKEMFPEKDFLPKKLQDFTKACRKAEVIPVHFKPSHLSEKDFYVENYYEIKIKSGFHGLGKFFAEIANFKYPTGITGVVIKHKVIPLQIKNIDNSESESHTTTTSFLFKTFTSKQ